MAITIQYSSSKFYLQLKCTVEQIYNVHVFGLNLNFCFHIYIFKLLYQDQLFFLSTNSTRLNSTPIVEAVICCVKHFTDSSLDCILGSLCVLPYQQQQVELRINQLHSGGKTKFSAIAVVVCFDLYPHSSFSPILFIVCLIIICLPVQSPVSYNPSAYDMACHPDLK